MRIQKDKSVSPPGTSNYIGSFSVPPTVTTLPLLNKVIALSSLLAPLVKELFKSEAEQGRTSTGKMGVVVLRAWLGGSQVPLCLHYSVSEKGLQSSRRHSRGLKGRICQTPALPPRSCHWGAMFPKKREGRILVRIHIISAKCLAQGRARYI